MNKTFFLLIIFGVLCFGCSKEEVDPSLPKLDMDFTWVKDQECLDKRSPEISIKEVPEGTKSLSITLYDRSNSRDHGGDTIPFEGKTVIPEGSVKGTYEGPCPPGWGASPNYELTVKALDETGKLLGVGKKVKQYPE